MSQEIRIGVKAATDEAGRNVGKLRGEVEGVAVAARNLDRNAKSAAASMGQLEGMARRVAQTKAILSRELGANVSDGDAETFIKNYSKQRAGSPRTRAFDDFGTWYHGHAQTFSNEAHATNHRRLVLARGLQGTSWSTAYGAPRPPGGAAPGGPLGPLPPGRFHTVPGGPGDMGGGARMALGLARGGLALAGIGGAMAMLGRGIGNASSEATNVDLIKRRLGDSGVSYLHAQSSARAAGYGLGINYKESAGLAAQYVKEAGNLTSDDMRGGRLSANMRTAWGFARSYGMELGEGGSAFATMSRTGVARDDNSQRRFAMMLADAISKSGYGAQAEELTRAVTQFADQSARLTLNTPNVGGFLTGMSSLMGTGIPGLDATAASAVINTADATLRRGGGMGEASLNFNYAALRKGNPGLSSIGSKILMEQGLFGSVGGTFYGQGAVARFLNKSGSPRAALFPDQTTNIEKILPMLRKQYGDGEMMLDATKNHFGLNSYGQAAALLEMQTKGTLGASAGLAGRAGLKLNEISATGMASFAAVANAGDPASLQRAYDGIRSRKDLRKSDLLRLDKEMVGSNTFEGRQEIMARFVASHDQEKTLATETRDRLASIDNALTDAGQPVLRALNMIVMGIEVLARTINPGMYRAAKANAEKVLNEGDGVLPASRATWGGVRGPSGGSIAGKAPAGAESSDMQYFMSRGYSKVQAAGIVGNLIQESGLRTDAVGDGGKATGLAQWHPDRRAIAKRNGFDLSTRAGQLAFIDWELRNTESRAGGRLAKATNARQAAEAVMGFERPQGFSWDDASGTHGYDSRVYHAERLASTPLPANAGKTGSSGLPLAVDVNGRVVVEDTSGRQIGSAPLKGVARATPSGGFPQRAGGY